MGLLSHSAGRAVVLWLGFVHPFVACLITSSNWISAIFFAIIFIAYPWCMHGLLFYGFTQFSHIQQECFHVKPHDVEVSGKGDRHFREWGVHMVMHAFDYAIESRLWLHLSIGLNLQVVHHLFPQVAWCHYKDLVPIVQEVCDEFGVRYSKAPTFWAAMASHVKYLGAINDEPHGEVFVEPQERWASRRALSFLGQLDESEAAEFRKCMINENKPVIDQYGQRLARIRKA